jgi:hypothetical protein
MKWLNSKALLIYLVAFVLPSGTNAQWPSADIYSCQVNWNQKPVFTGKPVLLNAFNENGYNNQPYFIDYNRVFITVAKAGSGTEIYQLDLEKSEYFAFTKTADISEFSAQIMPDKKQVSVVRIEADGKTQTLWAYPFDRSHGGKNLFPSLTNVGYYAWLNDHKLALFLVDSLPKLAIADIKTGSILTIQENIGRCLKVKNGFLYFTQKSKDTLFRIRQYNIEDQTIQNVFTLPENTDDFEVLANGNIIFAEKSKLKMFQPASPDQMKELGSLEKFGINNIKRIAVERDRILLVNQK